MRLVSVPGTVFGKEVLMKEFLASFLTNVGAIMAVLLGIAFLFGITGALMFFTILAYRANIFIGLGVTCVLICWIALLITIWEDL